MPITRQQWHDAMTNPNTDIRHKLSLVRLYESMALDPEATFDAMQDEHLDEKTRDAFRLEHDAYIAEANRRYSETVGADCTEPQNLTEEQQRILTALKLQTRLARYHAFDTSCWTNAYETILSSGKQQLSAQTGIRFDIVALVLPFIFTRLPDYMPGDQQPLDDAAKTTVIDLYSKFEQYLIDYYCGIDHVSKADQNELYARFLDYCTGRYLDELPTQENLSITQLPSSEFFYEPVSKPYLRMHDIAAAGRYGQPLDVARSGTTPVIVDAVIHGENGETITIDGIEREIQAAIGNMIKKNNGRPIIVTPDQIYKEYAQLDSSATVTEQQRTEVIRVMDKLMKAQARLDFTAELRQHTHIKRQSDYDYDAEGAGRLSGAMIAARKTEAWYNGENVGLAYIIYDYPMYYLQAHAVGQMQPLKGDILRLMDRPENKTVTSPGTQNRARDVAIKRYLLTRIARMEKDKSLQRRIMISEIIEDNMVEPVSAKTERTIRENAERDLQGLKGQKDGIEDFTLIKRGRKITGFMIILTKTKTKK